MPTVQTAFPTRQDAGIVGTPAMSRYRSDTAVIETAAGVGFGQPIARGTNDRGAVLMAAGLKLLGITRRDQGRAPIEGGRYVRGAPAAFFKDGDGVWVLSDAAVAPDSDVYWNPATGRYSSSNAGGNIQIIGWVFDTTATAAGQLVVIKR